MRTRSAALISAFVTGCEACASRHSPLAAAADRAPSDAGDPGDAATPADEHRAVIPARAKTSSAMTCVMGLRQVLPVHTNRISMRSPVVIIPPINDHEVTVKRRA